jgi:hypothetical protein
MLPTIAVQMVYAQEDHLLNTTTRALGIIIRIVAEYLCFNSSPKGESPQAKSLGVANFPIVRELSCSLLVAWSVAISAITYARTLATLRVAPVLGLALLTELLQILVLATLRARFSAHTLNVAHEQKGGKGSLASQVGSVRPRRSRPRRRVPGWPLWPPPGNGRPVAWCSGRRSRPPWPTPRP